MGERRWEILLSQESASKMTNKGRGRVIVRDCYCPFLKRLSERANNDENNCFNLILFSYYFKWSITDITGFKK